MLGYNIYFTFKNPTPTIGGITQGTGTVGFAGLLYGGTCTGVVVTARFICTVCSRRIR